MLLAPKWLDHEFRPSQLRRSVRVSVGGKRRGPHVVRFWSAPLCGRVVRLMLDSGAIVLFLSVLLGGNIGLGLAGVATHHGLIAMPTVWLVGLTAAWLRGALMWRLSGGANEPKPTVWRTLKHATLGGSKATVLSLLTPVAGYGWAHITHSLPTGLRWMLPVVALLAVGVWIKQSGMSWPVSPPQQKELRAALDNVWMGHVLWILATPLWSAPTRSINDVLSAAAERRGFEVDRASFHWIDEPYTGVRTAFTSARGIALIRAAEIPNDVFIIRVALTHDGVPTRVVATHNISNTAAVEERQLAAWRKWAGWTIVHDGRVRSIEIADLRGDAVAQSALWPASSRVQWALTNLQQTGQWRGVGRSGVTLDKPVAELPFALEDGTLTAKLPGRTLSLELGREPTPETLGSGVTYHSTPPSRPGALVPWAADRLRAVAWIGSNRIQWLKGWLFRASDQLEQLENEVVGIDPDETISEELGDLLDKLPLAEPSDVPGWPPSPLEPLMTPAVTGEGRWVTLGQDMLVPGSPGLPSPFVFTFIRTDIERAYIQTSITLWDPRQVELHIVAGTEEPKSTTGEVGSGTIPRDVPLLRRLVGAFNGAFQAVHGEYGMMEQGRLQLPPKPYAATIATFDDGGAGIGTWPRNAPIPSTMVSMRQNLTPLIVDGRLNPYRRTWWGGVPEGWTQETRTVRSGLCLTREGFMAYFYSPGVTPDALAKAMQQARCSYGMHLDMNAGHTGFEFYRVTTESELPLPNRALDRLWEAQGRVPGVDGMSFFSRLMVRKMPLMNFPRYIHTTPRDFFYLTRRPLLPGPALAPLSEGSSLDGKWRIPEVAGTSWPPPVAMTTLQMAEAPGATRSYIVTRVHISQFRVSPHGEASALLEAPDQGKGALWLAGTRLLLSPNSPTPNATLIARGEVTPAQDTVAAICLDQDDMLVLLQPESRGIPSPQDVHRLTQHVAAAACLYVNDAPRLLLKDPSTELPRPGVNEGVSRVSLSRHPAPTVQRIFEDTPILPPEQWALIQQRRVDYTAPASGAIQ